MGSRFPKPHPIEWLLLAVGLALVVRYFFLLDDAFVYFRYVDNLLYLRIGLVWNQGEYVEGFSSPLWAMLLIALRATGLSYIAILHGIALLAYAGFWAMCVTLNARLSPPGVRLNLPLSYAGLLYGVLCFFSSGLDSPLAILAAPAFALFILNPGSFPLQLALAFAPLARQELMLPLALCGAWAWFRAGRFPWRLTCISAAVLGAWTLFRVTYYADLFPNTYYLKSVSNWPQGVQYLANTVLPYHFHIVLMVVLALVLWLRFARVPLQLAARAVMVTLALVVGAYAVWVGGAPVHFRYLAFPFCLLACASAGVPEHAIARALPTWGRRVAPVAGLALAAFALTLYPPQLDRHPIDPKVEARMVERIHDPAKLRSIISVDGSDWRESVNKSLLLAWKAALRKVIYGSVIDTPLCMQAYKNFDKRVIQSYGLTEAILARAEVPSYRAGHKPMLRRMARDLVRVYETAPEIGRGMYRAAVQRGDAAEWIAKHLETIEVLERKVFNRHDLVENLGLALRFPPKIHPDLPPLKRTDPEQR